ncbi:MAG: hypothetical protein ACR2M9_03905 [Cyanophyceae cyanobacterium]
MTNSTDYTWRDNPLSVLFSCRCRLDEQQREKLKAAHNRIRTGAKPAVAKPVLSNSSIQVVDKTEPTVDIYRQFGMSSVVINDLINSRESISLPVIVKLQRMLDCEVIDVKELNKQFASYLHYVMDVME